MNMEMNMASEVAVFPFFAGAIVALGAISTIFWMVVSWRAMRAHERIADELREFMNRPSERTQQ